MDEELRSLPEVAPVPGETIARFKIVGVDSDGRNLYQKVEYSELTNRDYGTRFRQSSRETVIHPRPIGLQRNGFQPRSTRRVARQDLAGIASQYEDLTPETLKERHEQSRRDYPEIRDLADNEFVLVEVKRHPIVPKLIWGINLFFLIIVTSLWLIFASTSTGPSRVLGFDLNFSGIFAFIIVLLDLLLVLMAYISAKIYKNNKMFITSERVIQFQQRSLFDEKIQSIDLDGIEDVSSHQVGMVASLFNFGNVRLSTVGDETTYEQNLVYNPKRIVEQINNIVQAVKNDRLVPTKLGEPQFPLI
ncbi:MAG: hypothetical protein ACOX0Z_00665 [Candidatus Nanosyncoccaceae bacterium]|jgi:hypothetical protein